MNSFGKIVVRMGLLSMMSVLPLAAQIDNGVVFTTASPFYAGNTKMPAGSYKITQPEMTTDVLLVQSSDGAHAGFIDFVPTQSARPHAHSMTIFRKYGDTEYLNRVWVAGEDYGMKVEPTKAETEAAANANGAEHSTAANGE